VSQTQAQDAGMLADGAEATASGSAVRVVAGYTMVLPPGWRRIPVRQGTDEAIRDLLDEVVGRVGKSAHREKLVRARVELQGRLAAMAARARQNGGVDLYLPIEYIHGSAVPASFSVSEGTPAGAGGPDGGDPAEVLAYLATAEAGSTLVSVDGAAGARTERVAVADPDNEITLGSRRVDYMLTMPDGSGRWLMVVFSTLGDGNPEGQFARILVELFDAMMSTLRWTWQAA
jgi:hypothetical protein